MGEAVLSMSESPVGFSPRGKRGRGGSRQRRQRRREGGREGEREEREGDVYWVSILNLATHAASLCRYI